MENSITFTQISKRLAEQNQPFRTIPLHNQFVIIVTNRGGRILGPFKNESSSGILWVNQAFSSSAAFEKFISSGDWNIGGDRLWIAPEIPFFTKDRTNFYETTTPQPSVDPGTYTLDAASGGVRLFQNVTADIYESNLKSKSFSMEKLIKPAANPLRSLRRHSELMKDVTFCGYQQTVTITDTSPENPFYLEGWNLCQVVPGGEVYTPFNGEIEYIDYYEPADSLQTIDTNYAVLSATGNRRYKVGYPSAILTGRAAYLLAVENGDYCLYIKNYYNNPSSVYCCEPFDKPGKTGCSLFVYNDDGGLGGFTEFENTFQTIGGDTQLTSSTDSVQNWFYYGSLQRIKAIAKALMGITIAESQQDSM